MTPPLRIALVGAGPAGMYALGHFLESPGPVAEIDIFERMPTPWGLVRAGVAPDHPEKKLVIDRLFDFYLKDPRVRFIGNVEAGKDVSHTDLVNWYDAVIYAVGAAGDARMGIPGETLPGCWAAREFVGFYNGHPDYSDYRFDLSCERALVVGNGNVALDLARILTMPVSDLEHTDIADHALHALRCSAIREVVVLGRRGHLQGAFHNPELEELEHLDDVDVVVEGADLSAGKNDASHDDADWHTRRKVATLRRLAQRRPRHSGKRIVLRFLGSPLELQGRGKVEQVLVARNRLTRDEKGTLKAEPTNEHSVLRAGLVLRAVGYRGIPFPELPFDERRGVIRNLDGRVADADGIVPRVYVTGWIKRGCRGVIGSNRKCAAETVQHLVEDARAGRLPATGLSKEAVMERIKQRKPDAVFLRGWLAIDHAEREAGRHASRSRVKMTDLGSMLACASAGYPD